MALYINGQLQTMMPASSISNIRYVEEDDMVQLYYNGQWRDWKSGGMAYPVGTVTTFEYTGQVEEFTIPATGLWKLEVWGGQGGLGNKGGHSLGYKLFESGDTIYIAVGGQGLIKTGTDVTTTGGIAAGGWNGGGNGSRREYTAGSTGNTGGGGGATHIATQLIDDGQLKYYSQNTDYILIVAGGSGGGQYQGSEFGNQQYSGYGGAGGGLTGTNGDSKSGGIVDPSFGYGGSQSSGGLGTYGFNGSFGQGGAIGEGVYRTAGGGGGYYGGGAGGYNGCYGCGGGGSGYIGGVPAITVGSTTYSPSTENNIRSNNGLAQMTYLGIGS